MRISSQSSQFVFNLASDILKQEIINTYTPLLEKNWIQYDNVIDYLNSTIKAVNFTGISIDMPKQNIIRGKEIYYKPAKNAQDIISSRQLNVTFASVDSDLNYWLLFDIIYKNYLDTENMYVNPFTITCLDIHRDAIYTIIFKQIIFTNLSDNTFDYSQQKVNSKEFTMTFNFNFYEVDFHLNNTKVLEINPSAGGTLPTIIQKI